MNTALTAATRPRIASGVRSWRTVERTTTEMLSAAPRQKSAASESGKLVERPKTMVATPKAATATRSVRPACRIGGSSASERPITMAPSEGIARIHPKPAAPTPSTSVA